MSLVRIFSGAAALLVAAGLAAPTFAADEKKPGAGKPGAGGPGREAMIKKFDKNGDGKLDQTEMQAARSAMGDRKPAPGGDGKGPPGGRLGPEQMQALVKKFDKNGDGKLDEAEKGAAKEEFMKMRGGPGKPGEGKPGAGKPGEAGPGREAMIKKFDKNGDGQLDDGEKAAAREAFEKMRAQGGKPGAKPGEGKKPPKKAE